VSLGFFVDGVPGPGPGVVAEEARLSFSLFFDGSGAEHEFDEEPD
jgi:hypothetical protein